ncbi:MAG TPA: alpha/beta hydrolase [Acidimicrobiales bacterium]|nr:alpha/beta hydrolase [Acidimicrobiales bacterium]
MLVVLAGLAVVTSACDNGSPSGGPSSSTTTLPVATAISGSAPTGSFSGLGPVQRVVVARVVAGHDKPRLAADGTLGSSAVEIGYRQFGSGRDLVLISGEHASMTSWDPSVLLNLGAHFRVTIFDLPGIGFSAPEARYRSIGSLADLTAGLIWSLGLTKPVVLGWGLGGAIGMSLVERHPGVVSRLVLADAPVGGSAAVLPSKAVAAGLSAPLETTTELSRLYFPQSAEAQRAEWLIDVEGVVPDAVTSAAIIHQGELAANFYRSGAVARALHFIRVPTLIFTGADDEVVPAANAQILAGSIAHSHLVVFPGAGYASIFQFSSTFISDLVAFAGS